MQAALPRHHLQRGNGHKPNPPRRAAQVRTCCPQSKPEPENSLGRRAAMWQMHTVLELPRRYNNIAGVMPTDNSGETKYARNTSANNIHNMAHGPGRLTPPTRWMGLQRKRRCRQGGEQQPPNKQSEPHLSKASCGGEDSKRQRAPRRRPRPMRHQGRAPSLEPLRTP